MKHRLWHYVREAADCASGLLILAGGFAVIVFGVPIVAALLGIE